MDKHLLLCIIVDDEPLAQQVLENYIQRIDDLKLVEKCESAEDALKILSSHKVDAIFLDLDLKQINGLEFIEKLRGLAKSKYFIIITSALLPKDIAATKASSYDPIILIDHLTKPVSFERFQKAVRKVIEYQKTDDYS